MLEGNLVRLRAYERDDLEKARMIYNDPGLSFSKPFIFDNLITSQTLTTIKTMAIPHKP